MMRRLKSIAKRATPILPVALVAGASDGRRIVTAVEGYILLLDERLETQCEVAVTDSPTAPVSISAEGNVIGVLGANGVRVFGDRAGWEEVVHMPDVVAACGTTGGVAVGKPGRLDRVGLSGVDRSVELTMPEVANCLLVTLGGGVVAFNVIETPADAFAMVVDLELLVADLMS